MGPTEDAPTVRWATSLELQAVEERLTKKIDDRSKQNWNVATFSVCVLSVLVTVAPYIAK